MGNEIFRKDTYTFTLDVESTDNNNDNQIPVKLGQKLKRIWNGMTKKSNKYPPWAQRSKLLGEYK